MIQVAYKSKKELKECKGKRLVYMETSLFGPEYLSTGSFCVTNTKRTYFARITMKNDLINKVE